MYVVPEYPFVVYQCMCGHVTSEKYQTGFCPHYAYARVRNYCTYVPYAVSSTSTNTFERVLCSTFPQQEVPGIEVELPKQQQLEGPC